MTLRRKRRAAAALCLLLLIEALAAFADEATFSNQSVTGLVTGVSGSEVTIQLGEVTSQAPGGEPPQSPGGELSQTPGFLSSGESLTFTVTDATAVAVEEAGSTRDGTAQDIAQGSLVRVVFGQSQTVASVTVLASNAPGVPGAQADNGTAATTIAQGGAAVGGNAHVVVGEGCVWTLSGDSSVSTLENNGTIVFGGYTITLADGTVLSQ